MSEIEIDPFGELANSIWKEAQDETPTILYHYTRTDGALSIAQSRRMWASAFECMNDPMEFRLGLEAAKNEIIRSIDRMGITLKEELKSKWLAFYEDEIRNPKLRPYVISLSDTCSNPHMWEHYADDMQGIALKFSFNKVSAIRSNCHIVRMFYDKVERMLILNKQLENINALLVSNSSSFSSGMMVNILIAYLQISFLYAISLKDSKWSPEGEWRLVTFASDAQIPNSRFFGDIKFRGRGSEFVDFLEIDLCRAGLDLNSFVTGAKFRHISSINSFAKKSNLSVVPHNPSTKCCFIKKFCK